MGFIMRPLIRPRSIAFTSGERLASVDGDGSPSLSGRLSAIMDVVPLFASASSVRAYHSYDLLVTSHNPLLAALLLYAASRTGKSVAIVHCGASDPWPYDLAVTDEVGHIIAAALSLEVPGCTTGAMVPAILEMILADLPRSYPVIPHLVSPSSRHPADEGVFFISDRGSHVEDGDQYQRPLTEVFDRFMVRRPLLGTVRKGRTVVFARRMFLTGRPRSFGESRICDGLLTWELPVFAVGSARWDLPTYPDAAKAMMEDILTLCRGLPSDT
jgi:hypothetical protein